MNVAFHSTQLRVQVLQAVENCINGGQVQELEQFYTYITKLLMNLNFLPL